MTQKIYMFSKNKHLEELISRLLPTHKRFIDVNAGVCEIHAHKRPCKQNLLNWIDVKYWPNDNANEYLDYKTFNLEAKEFTTDVYEPSKQDLVYLDARTLSAIDIGNMSALKKAAISPLDVSVLVMSHSKVDIELITNDWATSQAVFIDLYDERLVYCAANFAIDDSSDFYKSGNDKSERQAIVRKRKSFISKFSGLSSSEQEVMLKQLIDQFLIGGNDAGD
ncbi:hypothetical protein [Paraglaciecola sp. 20A4]|uniref:hypothetical protein n=1 Tax=Paraglaciecola sp. 20A4 TaxID=2687288 RepID=UPI00140E3C9D|nr:hypothetical protein [Paraglaciecola sp. 20A4]